MALSVAIKDTARTAKVEDDFFKALGDLGNVYAACQSSGMSRTRVYDLKDKDPEFLRRYNEALAKNLADFELELKRRAVHGVDEPVYHKGKVVGHRKKHSDNLMMFSLSALHPEKYRQKFDVTGSVQHNHKAELPEAVLNILDSLKAVNVTPSPSPDPDPDAQVIECSTWNNEEPQQIEHVTGIQGDIAGANDGQFDPAGNPAGNPAGWKVRRAESLETPHQGDKSTGSQSDKAAVKVRRYVVE